MNADIPSVEDVEPVTVETTENVTPSVIDTVADTIGQDADSAETSEPKKKLSKKEKATKRARKAKRRARKVAETKATEDDDVEEVVLEETEESDPEKVIPLVGQPSVDDEWLPEHEPQGDNEDKEADESNKEDVATMIKKRRKAKGKLRMNENRTRMGIEGFLKILLSYPQPMC
ncbi:hypothetical protein LIER_29818 [Lithospermum erythrorhizon]|uniref:Uncharacterized protein n=1 Tax=Lithospermum erythrorhizon TaxID=34254 RepID=A0AAV3RP30_LITER